MPANTSRINGHNGHNGHHNGQDHRTSHSTGWLPWNKVQDWVARLTGPEEERPKVGLALSAGGAKGLAHVGVIQVLEENGIEVDAIAGSSMGAYVGSLWAAGYNGRELEGLAATMKSWKDVISLMDPVFPPRRGFLKGHRNASRLRKSLGRMRFKDLDKDLYVIATELDSFARTVFHEGDVVDAVMASAAIPGVCEPVKLNGIEYLDGGVCDPLPVSVLKQAGMDYIIAVSVLPTVEELNEGRYGHLDPDRKRNAFQKAGAWLNKHLNYFAKGNLLDILRGAAMGSQMRLIETSAAQANVVIRPIVNDSLWHDYNKYQRYIQVGREAATAALPQLEEYFINPQKQCA